MIDKIYLSECDPCTLEQYMSKGEITLFRFGCAQEDKTKTLVVRKEDEIVAFMTISIEDDIYVIDEFEVIKSKRRQGIGEEIINKLKKDSLVKKIKLYPENDKAKKFWEKCNFSLYMEGDIQIMFWINDRY